MKKLSLEMLRLTSGEVLHRSQMKMITGGYGSGGSCSSARCSATVRCCAGDECDSAGDGWCKKQP